jgi:subfamily B ATP-binding cassette protein MsbA
MRNTLQAYKPLFRYCLPYKSLLLWGTVCSVIFGVSSGFGIPLIVEKVLKVVFEAGPDEYTLLQIFAIALAIPMVFLVRSVFGFLGAWLLSDFGLRVLTDLRNDLFAKLQVLPFSYFESRSSGDLISRVNNDTSLLQQILMDVCGDGIKQPFQMAAGVGGLVYICVTNGNMIFFLMFVAAIPIAMIPVRLLAKRLRRRGKQSLEALGDMNHQLEESLGATLEVRTLNLQDRQQSLFLSKIRDYSRAQLKLIAYEKIQQPSMELISTVIIAVSFVYCYAAQIGYPVFSSLALVLYFTFDPMKKIMRLVANLQKTESAVDRIQEVLESPVTVKDPENPVTLPSVQGHIVAKDVSFSYGNEPVLKNINISIPAGTFCALVGASGAGKSTFSKLIPRLYDTTRGTLSVDGVDVRQFSQQALRRNIAYLSQHPVLFHLSVRENILLSRPDASQQELEEAARNAYALDFIEALPHGWDTLLGERGSTLSGGQIQRVALARTFLKNAPILILDEATSALDSQSEALIQKALDRLVVGRTVFCIAHRLSTIRNAQKILVFDQGNIVATGTHEELLETSPIYANLVRNQLF